MTDSKKIEDPITFGQSASTDDANFGKFCKHVPRILRRQLISKLVNQYVSQLNGTALPDIDVGADSEINTSICRFHGALLFVDISGFTVLSQKLKVDQLKNEINSYFQKIVDIIYRFDGEIIKFAGDALFIIWQTKANDTSKTLSKYQNIEYSNCLVHTYIVHSFASFYCWLINPHPRS